MTIPFTNDEDLTLGQVYSVPRVYSNTIRVSNTSGRSNNPARVGTVRVPAVIVSTVPAAPVPAPVESRIRHPYLAIADPDRGRRFSSNRIALPSRTESTSLQDQTIPETPSARGHSGNIQDGPSQQNTRGSTNVLNMDVDYSQDAPPYRERLHRSTDLLSFDPRYAVPVLRINKLLVKNDKLLATCLKKMAKYNILPREIDIWGLDQVDDRKFYELLPGIIDGRVESRLVVPSYNEELEQAIRLSLLEAYNNHMSSMLDIRSNASYSGFRYNPQTVTEPITRIPSNISATSEGSGFHSATSLLA